MVKEQWGEHEFGDNITPDMDRNRWIENYGRNEGDRGRDNGWNRNSPENITSAHGNRWKDNHRPVEGKVSRNKGENMNLEKNITTDRRTGSHPCTYHRHHSKSQDYHRGWTGGVSRI